jgi:maltooligosyltrehalose trehalohydrolase
VVRRPGETEFRVWAPHQHSVTVLVDGRQHPLRPEDGGTFAGLVPAGDGSLYRYLLDDGTTVPDPCARSQPQGVAGPSEVLDPRVFRWTDGDWRGLDPTRLVTYELHVGTFTSAGTFAGVIPRLPGLRELGVTAIELMPVATFPGTRGWGYDGLLTWAPHHAYGGAPGLARLVDAAHAEGIGVILDVVYNHVGPGADQLGRLGPYFTERHHTSWGHALDYARRGVREWAIQNAEQWVRDLHVDGLRLDATHAVFDDSSPHVLAELGARVHAHQPRPLVIAEVETGDLRPIRDWDLDLQWADELHHAVHALLTGERAGHYADYGRVADVAAQLERFDASRLVVCAQNHDQVGNRAEGDRLHGAQLRLAAFCALLAPGSPLLFMGEEYDESHPFQYFTDHTDPALADATRAGRRREFAASAQFGGDVPDPQDPDTFTRSVLDPEGGDPAMRGYYRSLLRLRRTLPPGPARTSVDEARRVLHARRGNRELLVNFSDAMVDGVPAWSGAVR